MEYIQHNIFCVHDVIVPNSLIVVPIVDECCVNSYVYNNSECVRQSICVIHNCQVCVIVMWLSTLMLCVVPLVVLSCSSISINSSSSLLSLLLHPLDFSALLLTLVVRLQLLYHSILYSMLKTLSQIYLLFLIINLNYLLLSFVLLSLNSTHYGPSYSVGAFTCIFNKAFLDKINKKTFIQVNAYYISFYFHLYFISSLFFLFLMQ